MYKKYLEDIDFNLHKKELIDIIDMLMYDVKNSNKDFYDHIKCEIREIAYGKVLDEETAHKWVENMQPVGEHWNIEQTTQAMQSLGYNLDRVMFYVVANMMYNDYHDLVENDETMALKLAKDWLTDTDAKDDKLYEYWKYVIKK